MAIDIVIANYLRVAQEDLQGSKILNKARNRNAAYLCEQAAEKIVVAVLVSESIHNTRNHMLASKIDDIPDANPFKVDLRKVEHLSAYATAYRYPTPAGRLPAGPSELVLSGEIDLVLETLNKAASYFIVDLTRADAPAKNIGPLR